MNMSTIKLYELASYYSVLLSNLEEVESAEQMEEATSDIYETLDAIDVSVQEKVESIGDIIKGYQAESAALKAEAKRLTDRAATADKAANNLMSYVETVMKQNDFKELKGLKHTFKFTSSTSLACKDPYSLPKQFQKTTVTADIAGMKTHLKQTYDEKGFKLVGKLPAKPKGNEILFTDLNDTLKDMGLEYVINSKLSLK